MGTLPPDSVLSITPLTDSSYIAVRVPIASDTAVAGVRWFNNDSSVAFPRMLVTSGVDPYPPNVAEAVTVGYQVTGPASDYAEMEFTEPIASQSDALYLIFQLPPDAPHEGWGEGGGAAIGYRRLAGGPGVYLSAEGEDWVRLSSACWLLVEPILAAREPGMRALSASHPANEGESTLTQPEVPAINGQLGASPTPFNGGTEIRYTLAQDAQVRLTVYDVRGALVRVLRDERLSAGSYATLWDGRGSDGRPLASGRYLARLTAGKQQWTTSMMLVR
jgi:hypothetical protein